MAVTTRGDGPPVVLLHPVGLSSAFWPVLPDKLASDRRVISVDLAGHGASPDARRPGRMAARVDEVARLVADRAGAGAVVLGVSFGGMIAMNLAISRPDLVRGLVVAACPPEIPQGAREAILDRGRAAEAGGMEAVIQSTLERWFSSEASPQTVERVRTHLASLSPSNWAAAWEAVAEHAALPDLHRIQVPTLAIAGDSDLATPLTAMEAIAARVPHGRLEVMKGAPHMLHLERPDAFAELVRDFLAELGP